MIFEASFKVRKISFEIITTECSTGVIIMEKFKQVLQDRVANVRFYEDAIPTRMSFSLEKFIMIKKSIVI